MILARVVSFQSGGRSWWAHIESTRMNTEPIILKNGIEDVREAGAAPLNDTAFRER
jgi:hypothetical protein